MERGRIPPDIAGLRERVRALGEAIAADEAAIERLKWPLLSGWECPGEADDSASGRSPDSQTARPV